MSEKEKVTVLEAFKRLPKNVQMAVIAGKTLAELEKQDGCEGSKPEEK